MPAVGNNNPFSPATPLSVITAEITLPDRVEYPVDIC